MCGSPWPSTNLLRPVSIGPPWSFSSCRVSPRRPGVPGRASRRLLEIGVATIGTTSVIAQPASYKWLMIYNLSWDIILFIALWRAIVVLDVIKFGWFIRDPQILRNPKGVEKKKITRDPMFHRFCQAMVEFGQAKPSKKMGISMGKPSLVGW